MKFGKIHVLLAFSMLIIVAVIINSCKKEEPLPPNPYDSIDYGTDSSDNSNPDPASFIGIHSNILAARCAMPGCHDGNFEPDFRTVQSAYNTLVYHRIIKNNVDKDFIYRVIPYDTAKSVLHERITNCCFVNQDDRMPQDNIGVPLPDKDINNITSWIMNGAKDMFGQSPAYPNTEPAIIGYVAFDSLFQRIDTIRMGGVFYNPFITDQNEQITIWVAVEDDVTEVSNLTNNKLKLSLNFDDFSSAQVFNGTYTSFGNHKIWQFTFNTSSFSPGATIFMRYYTNDGNHSTDTEFPTSNLVYQYKTLWAFYINP